MTLFLLIQQFLGKAGAKIPDLRAKLVEWRTKYPDLAPEIDPMIAALDLPVDAAGVATAVVPELGSIAMFKFDGREHPSDAF